MIILPGTSDDYCDKTAIIPRYISMTAIILQRNEEMWFGFSVRQLSA